MPILDTVHICLLHLLVVYVDSSCSRAVLYPVHILSVAHLDHLLSSASVWKTVMICAILCMRCCTHTSERYHFPRFSVLRILPSFLTVGASRPIFLVFCPPVCILFNFASRQVYARIFHFRAAISRHENFPAIHSR